MLRELILIRFEILECGHYADCLQSLSLTEWELNTGIAAITYKEDWTKL